MLQVLPWWAWAAIVWWAGMIPAAAIAGDMQRRRAPDKKHPDAAVLIFVLGWPVFLVLFPVALAHLAAQARGKKDGKPKP